MEDDWRFERTVFLGTMAKQPPDIPPETYDRAWKIVRDWENYGDVPGQLVDVLWELFKGSTKPEGLPQLLPE